jgi:hypothetical protein
MRHRITFLLERLLLRGAHYRLFVIAALIGLVSVLAGTIVHFAQSGFAGNWGDAIWWAFLRLSDPGYLGDDQGAVLRTISTIVTVLGYVIFLGALVAIMTQWLNQTMRDLESGFTPIAQSNHILLLGWTNRTAAVVQELLLSEGRVRRFLLTRGARKLRLVILSERLTAALTQELRERLGPLWNPRQIILRVGTPLRIEHLRRVDFRNAAAILLPAEDFAQGGPTQADTRAIKTLLSITTQTGVRRDAELPLAVAEIVDARKVPVARNAYGGPIEILASDAIVGRLIAQNVRHRNLSHVYRELLTHGRGNEIYIRDVPALMGAPVQALAPLFPQAIVLGTVRRKGDTFEPCLNPGRHVMLGKEDRLVFMAPTFELTQPENFPQEPGVEPTPMQVELQSMATRRILVLGWSHKGPALLNEFDSYAHESFEIDVLSAVSREDRLAALANYDFRPQRIRLRHIEGDYATSSDLRRCDPACYDSIIFLASDWLAAGEESDARTILGYLLLREILGNAARPDVLIELLDPGNETLFRRRPGEVLISPLIMSHMLAQVALRRELRTVFDELFGPGGAEIYFNPPSRYHLESREVAFRDIQRATAASAEIALGVRHADRDGTGANIVLNPSRQERWTLSAEDEVIVLSTDPR